MPKKFDPLFVRNGVGLFLCALAMILAGCSPAGDSPSAVIGSEVYRPAAAAPGAPLPTQALQTPTGAATLPPQASPTPFCASNLRYIEDLTLPDGSPVQPGSALDKRWRVANSGTCNWDKRYRLKPIAGPPMGAPAELALYPARSGVEATIQITFTAPSEPGAYRSAWQAYDPQNQPFGDPIFIDIFVSQ